MAKRVLIIGESGSGKSMAIRNLNPKETFIINIANKELLFPNAKNYTVFNKDNKDGNMAVPSNFADINKLMDIVNDKLTHIKTLIIDDWQYSFVFELFDRLTEKGYDKFNDLAKHICDIAKKPMNMRDDLMVFYLTHAEESVDIDGRRRIQAKTAGKMISNQLTLEGLFSFVLYSKAKKAKDPKYPKGVKYIIETVTDGENTCKAGMDIFSEDEIPNDLELVRNTIMNY